MTLTEVFLTSVKVCVQDLCQKMGNNETNFVDIGMVTFKEIYYDG
jgi:hypothetical protein